MSRNITSKLTMGIPGAALLAWMAVAPVPSRAQGRNNFPQGPRIGAQSINDAGYLGVGMQEVSADQAKQLKLAAVRGVFVANVTDGSPAAKAGIKTGDVITEYNAQRVEGMMQLARMVHETPPGHTAAVVVWRDGHAQTLSVQLGQASPEAFPMQGTLSNLPRGMNLPAFFGRGSDVAPAGSQDAGLQSGNGAVPPQGRTYGRRGAGDTPTLGIGAQDMSGQLGSYFGVPNNEGVLVSDVRKDSPGEKAGLKTGDVITKVDGQAVRNIAELRDRLREKRDAQSVTLTVVRQGKEMSISAQPEKPQPRTGRSGDAERRIPL